MAKSRIMGRPPKDPMDRSVTFSVTIPKKELDKLDEMRGEIPRSHFIKQKLNLLGNEEKK